MVRIPPNQGWSISHRSPIFTQVVVKAFELEAFEPRLLLSSDGLSAATLDVPPPDDATLSAIAVEDQEVSASNLEQPAPQPADLFSEVEGESLEAPTPSAQIARQGVALQNPLPDLTISNVVIPSSNWTHSFLVQFRITNSGSAAVSQAYSGFAIQHWVAVSDSATYDSQNIIYSTQYGHDSSTMYLVPEGGLGVGEALTWTSG